MMSDRHFQGNGIRLRAPEPEDLEVMFRFENATDVWEMSNTTGPYSRFQLKQYIEQTQNDLFADRQLRLMNSQITETVFFQQSQGITPYPLPATGFIHHNPHLGPVVQRIKRT